MIRPGKSFEQVAANELDGRILATPTVCGRALLLRTDSHLYRIEATPATATTSRTAESKAGLGTN